MPRKTPQEIKNPKKQGILKGSMLVNLHPSSFTSFMEKKWLRPCGFFLEALNK